MTSAHLLPRLILSWLILASLSAQSVVRGPYLQKGTPDSLVLRWRTDSATDSVVRYGMALGSLTGTIRRSGNRTEHEILITGLSSDKRYFYSIGNSAGPLAGDDASYFFQTAPLPGVDKSTRIWVTGDPGTGWSGARALRDKYKNYTGTRGTDLWLMLGDNAYPDGTDSEYQYALFDTYPELLRQVVLWPAFGNHDDNSADSATQSGPYYNIFSLPAQGEAGGVISGTEAYYSFDYGNIHFVCLDSSDSNRSTDGPMLTWLEQDLAANDKKWLIAYWHHPPYSKGTHDSDREANLIEMRQNALPILEAHGVDLVLTGHSHNYERSFLLGGHYGSSSTLQSWMILDSGDGREDGDGVYRKPGQPAQPHQGTVYVVSGNAGKVPGPNGPLNHPVMLSSNVDLGSVVLDINGNRLEAVALDVEGKVRDYFTLRKDEPIGPQPSTTLGQVFMGPLADGSAWTRILVANQDLVACDMEIAFHQDAVVGEAIPTINGRKTESLTATLPPGGLKKFDLTATDELLQGSVTIFAKPPCQPASLSSQGTAFIEQHEHPPPQDLRESFAMRPNHAQTWLRDGRCLAISAAYGTDARSIRQDLGIAVSGVIPGQAAPTDSRLEIQLFDDQGTFFGEGSRPVTGRHDPFLAFDDFPGFSGAGTMIFCLDSSDRNYLLDLSVVRINQRGKTLKLNAGLPADQFESGEVSAWSR